MKYLSYLYVYERSSYGHIKSADRHGAEMRLMRETINQQYAEIAKLNRNIESLAGAERVLDHVTQVISIPELNR